VKILHVTPFYEPAWAYGGMARCSASLCRALASRGHEVTVATALLDPGHPREDCVAGVRVRRFAGPRFLARRLLPWGRGLRAFLDARLPSMDVVHIHGHRNPFSVVASRVLGAAGRPWVLLTNGTFPHHGQHAVAKALFDRVWGDGVVHGAAALVAVSEAEAADLPRPARVIPNGVEPCGAASRSEPPGSARILFVGTDRPQKRGHVLPRLLDALPGARLHLVGRFGAPFLRLFARFEGRVTTSGVLAGDALGSAYANADVVVHPSVGEAFGLVPFEAALAGTAAVVAGGHGCGEWFGRAGGCVVPPDDLPALLHAVRARLDAPAIGTAEARAVAAFARDRLTWDRAAEAMESVYQGVLGGRA
jgi:glycosyltransferase involved in cell wall biosynthesis